MTKITNFQGGASAAISGLAGISHMIVGVGLLLLFIAMIKSTTDSTHTTESN